MATDLERLRDAARKIVEVFESDRMLDDSDGVWENAIAALEDAIAPFSVDRPFPAWNWWCDHCKRINWWWQQSAECATCDAEAPDHSFLGPVYE